MGARIIRCVVASGAALVIGACGAGGPPTHAGAAATPGHRAHARHADAGRHAARSDRARRAHRAAPPRPPGPDPGTLPQTEQRPTSRTPAFAAEMRQLWVAVRDDSPGVALPAFFPEAAYAQLKAIGDASADWRYRLYADYRLDIEAAHALLGAGASRARLLAVLVPFGYAHWVTPGVCENRVGYYEVPNSRVVYREDGVMRSFGIASMISWRGRWYVIHLGYVGQLSQGGRVDNPSLGIGHTSDPGTC